MKTLKNLPQRCPGAGCSLRDRTVPREFRVSADPKKRRVRRMFTAALVVRTVPDGEGRTDWKCPTCGHEWSQVGVAP